MGEELDGTIESRRAGKYGQGLGCGEWRYGTLKSGARLGESETPCPQS